MPRKTIPTLFDLKVGARIRALRQERGLSLGALADLCGLSKGHLSTIEHGLASITIQTIERLAEGLGFAPLYLLAVGADDRTQAAELLRFLPNTEVRKLTQQLRAQIDRE